MSNGGDLLVRVLRENGVEVVFGVVSVHNLPLVEAVDRDLRFVPVRHEAAAVNAADGYARASGGLGCALTSTGTGAGNAAGSLVEALSAGSRVLHVTGQIDSGYLGLGRGVIHETRDQLGMLAAISKHAAGIPSVEAAAEVLGEAVRRALAAPYGPASVEWPIDLQYAAHASGPSSATPTTPAPRPVPAAEAVAEAVRLLGSARRPLIWAGGGAREAGGELSALAERLGAPILTSNAGRGAVPEDHELVVGNFAANPAAASLIAEADLLLSVGTHFRSNETRHYKLVLPERHIQIDLDPAALGRVYPTTVGLHGDAAGVLAELLSALPAPEVAEGWRALAVRTREAVRARLGSDIGKYGVICDAMRAGLDRRSPIARDVTIPSSQWGNRLLPIYDPATNIFPLGGGIGQGLAMGIGAALARPDVPTLVMAGDGGLAVHLGELATLAQERPWLVLVVFNDGGYGVLRNMQDAHLGRRSGVDLHTPDFGTLAASMGLPHGLVTDPADFEAVFASAVARREPYLLEVDVTAIGPAPSPFIPPVEIP
ncbi:thiamine pyrophosphate-binding protein [Streptosporangium sp. NPDC051023]|uniref:thiamine pyrophosphate-binding protein n=1 Tax=Streptosporangium sp. NPDC051023 TaxID=3155410 RepID=UPI00344C2F79